MAEVTVELSDLRGWAQQVNRASNHMDASEGYARSHIADADFGRILELITGDYADMIPKFHDILDADGAGLGLARGALSTAADNYKAADERASGNLASVDGGQSAQIEDDGVAQGFTDPVPATAELVAPGGGGAAPIELPEVSFGFLFDKVCDTIVWVGGPDPREKVTRWLAGDLDKAAQHVAAWRAVAECADAVQANLAAGTKSIGNTWTGSAAAAAIGHIGKWETALGTQSGAMRKMGEHLSGAIDEAVKMAQVVVDIIKTIVHFVTAALSNAAIPFYGQWKLIKTVKEAITMVWNAWKVVRVFLDMLKLIVDTIKMCAASFSRESLPPAPAGVPAS